MHMQNINISMPKWDIKTPEFLIIFVTISLKESPSPECIVITKLLSLIFIAIKLLKEAELIIL